VQEPDLCQGCGKRTTTIHGLCSQCWYPKRPGSIPAPSRRTASLSDLFWGGLGNAVENFIWFFPGAALILLGLVAFSSDILLGIGGVALLGGVWLKFSDLL
jgi:hypothetical protein